MLETHIQREVYVSRALGHLWINELGLLLLLLKTQDFSHFVQLHLSWKAAVTYVKLADILLVG